LSQSNLDQKHILKVTKEIAQALNEHDKKPLRQIESITRLCGEQFVRDLLKQALDVQQKGGMVTASGDKQRTLGGVFFALAREQMPEEEKLQVFYLWVNRARKRVAHEAQFELFEWDLRQEIIDKLNQEQGEINDVKITLQGRPSQIERRQNLVIATLTHHISENITMPTGVPHPKQFEMPYTVYIGAKQWEQVEEALEKNKDDQVIIEGFAAFDADTNAMAVFTLTATTLRLAKKARRESQATAAKAPNKAPAKPNNNKGGQKPTSRQQSNNRSSKRDSSANVPFAPTRLEDRTPPKPLPEVVVPEGMGEAAARRYTDLQRAAITYRQRISDIESKPIGQQFGLEMTQKLLSSIEKQIKDLEGQLEQ
jgi:hypothetical protein